ncbi:ThuA domain-containing protein [Winogradskya humida]|uniref:ThuA domain-containing protein n=1 Tax=Winogradskya humida TaxID=113566 RepID=UPI001944FC6C|nr:ThuA domain-containing protein [Actinoplanes humidus]
MRALVVRGGWAGHEPVACTELFIGFLRGHGASVEVAETLTAYEDEGLLDRADLIVQCWTGGTLTEEQEHNLVHRVRTGAGFAGWHGGIVATAYEARDYQFMIGGRFLCHPGEFVDYDVNVTAAHPIMKDITDFSVRTEQYYCHVDPTLEVLATTTFTGAHDAPETAGAVMPVVWLRHFGHGRVFVNTLGHSPADLQLPQTRTITERGLLWAAG